MPALDYPDNNAFRQGVKPTLAVFGIVVGLLAFQMGTYAEDCEDIQDLDDRAECYARKKEEKEEEYESVSKKLEEIRNKKDEIAGKISQLASQISVTQEEINELQSEIDALEAQIEELNENLKDRRVTLKEKEDLRNSAIRALSKKNLLNEWEKFISVSQNFAGLNGFEYAAYNYIFDRAVSKNAVNWIKVLNEEITGFERDKAEALELKNEIATEQANLIAVKTRLDNERYSAESEHTELAEEQEEKSDKLLSLEEEIARLSAKQQEILNLKGGGNISGYEAAEYRLPDPPFKPAFAAMSYGAFTHYKGMSQYGAKGRAEDGKDYKDILEFYYKEDVKEKDDFPDELCVDGFGDMDFQRYLYGIAEMPSDWPEETLKAQAVAARSYAYRYVKAGKCICTTQSCQVFLKSKSDNPPDKWKEAVDDTKDKIVDGDVVTYYSSTTGGYIENVGWDLDGSQWPGDAYEKKAGSPWFYKAWYTQTYNSNSSTCGRDTPWLNEEEMADILNAWVVWRKGDDDDKDHVSPITTSCWGGDPYSMDKMADKADDYGGRYTDISRVHTPTFNSGRTTQICFDTNRGEVCINGEEFKTVFNLRAPGYVAIRSRLYDIEHEN